MQPVAAKRALITALFFSFFLVSLPNAQAHKIQVFAYGEGDSIVTKAYFSSGKGVQGGQVTVQDADSDRILLEGNTDTEGLFQFAIPEAAKKGSLNLKILVNTGEGHRAEWLLSADEYLESEVGESTKVPEFNQQEKAILHESPSVSQKDFVSSCDEKVVARIIEDALDKKLAPVKEMIQQSQERGPRLQDIIGGIGYIIGLAGIAAYMMSKRKTEND